MLRGRIIFTPREDGRGYDFSAPTRFDRLFTGIIVKRPDFIRLGDLGGTEHIGVEDTFDGDYGRLLERAYQRVCGKCGTSPTELPCEIGRLRVRLKRVA